MDQWNAKPPPLSFWSRRDWAAEHQEIAKKHVDLYTRQEMLQRDDKFKQSYVHEYPSEDKMLCEEIPMQSYTAEQRNGTSTNVIESHKEGLPCDSGGLGSEIHDRRKNQFNENSIKKCSEENLRIGSGEFSQDQKWRRGLREISLEEKRKRRGSSDVSVEDKQKIKGSVEKKIGGSGELSWEEKLKQRGSVEIFSEDKKKIGGSSKRLADEQKKTGTGEKYMDDKKRKGSHDISPDGKNKRRVNEIVAEVRHDRRGSPEDKKRRGSYEMSPEVRQKIIGSREISPIEKQNISFLRRQYQPVETTSLAGIQTENYQHFDIRVSGSQQFGARYDGIMEDGMAYRSGAIHEEPYHSSLYENRIPEVQFPGYQRESTDFHGYMPHIENPPFPRSSFLGSHNPRITTPYENFGMGANLSYNRNNTTSAIQRYAPRLDELNHPRVNNIGPDPALLTGGVYEPRAPRPYLDSNGYPPGPYFRQ